jgi:RNA polymerase sigma-70 factor (ECF subfamily)
VQARRKRFEPVDPRVSSELTARFFTAAATGDLDGLMAMLAPNVVWTADSDGKASAARRPVSGAERVARLIVGLVRFGGTDGRVEPAIYNSAPALVLYTGDHLEGVVSFEIVDGRITNFYAMRNPEKLSTVTVPRRIGR